MWLINSTDLEFIINGYEYRTYLEVEDDNQKLFHLCFLNGKEVVMEKDFYNHSPYSKITPDEFRCHLYDVGHYGIAY
jgi:hypothetical protein